MNIRLFSACQHPHLFQGGLIGMCVRSLGSAPIVQRSGTLVSAAGWPVSQTKGRPPFLHVIKPGSQGIHCVLGLVLVSKKTFLPWGLGSEVGASRICGLSDSSEISRILKSKMLSEWLYSGKDRLRWLSQRFVCCSSTNLFLISLRLHFLIWELVPISLFLVGKAWSSLFLEKLWAAGLSLAALLPARLISVQPLWPQHQTTQLQLRREAAALENSGNPRKTLPGEGEKSPSWQTGIAWDCSGASGHLAYKFWSTQHKFKPPKAVLPGFLFHLSLNCIIVTTHLLWRHLEKLSGCHSSSTI